MAAQTDQKRAAKRKKALQTDLKRAARRALQMDLKRAAKKAPQTDEKRVEKTARKTAVKKAFERLSASMLDFLLEFQLEREWQQGDQPQLREEVRV